MEHFTTPTMKGEEDKKNDPTFLNTLVIVTFSYTEYSVCLGREYRVGVDRAGGEWRWWYSDSDTLTEMIQIVKTDIFSPPLSSISGSYQDTHMTNSIRLGQGEIFNEAPAPPFALHSTICLSSYCVGFIFLFLVIALFSFFFFSRQFFKLFQPWVWTGQMTLYLLILLAPHWLLDKWYGKCQLDGYN